ncbi:MAG: hypothetical protein ACI9MC_000709 [Kiritimatiellia bacterium]|jgi:hypothetical protein
MGGLPRRNDRVEHYKSLGVTLVVDAGNTLSPRQNDDPGQTAIKADAMAQSWKLSGVDGVALSERDLGLGLPLLQQLTTQYELPVLAANLTCGGQRPFPAYRVVERGGQKIGVVGITMGAIDGCEVGDPAAAVHDAVAQMGEVDLRIGLLPMDRRQLRDLGMVPLDLAVLAGSASRLNMGDTVPLSVIPRGKQLGVASVTFVAGGHGVWSSERQAELKDEVSSVEGRLLKSKIKREEAGESQVTPQEIYLAKRLEKSKQTVHDYGDGAGRHAVRVVTIDLDDNVADHAATAVLVERTQARITKAETGGVPIALGPRQALDGPYLGADGCRSCHPAQTAQWLGTKHAQAYKVLVDDNNAMNSTCVGCHVTGWKRAGGPERPAAVGGMRDVQCEACHGPSRAHAKRPEVFKPIRSPDVSTCTECHDGDRDGGQFDPLRYHDKIVH